MSWNSVTSKAARVCIHRCGDEPSVSSRPLSAWNVRTVILIQGAYKSRKPGNVREFCNSGKLRENSGNLKCTQGIFLPFAVFFMMQSAPNNTQLFTVWYLWTATVLLLLVVVHRILVDVIILCFEILCFEVVAEHLQSCQHFWRQADCFIMTFYLVCIQFLSVWFLVYNCLEKTTQTVCKTCYCLLFLLFFVWLLRVTS